MSISRTVGQKVSGSLEYEDGGSHPAEFDLEVLEMHVNEIQGAAKKKVAGIRTRHGAKLPDGKCTAKFVFEGGGATDL
jgi:hypothetical protein